MVFLGLSIGWWCGIVVAVIGVILLQYAIRKSRKRIEETFYETLFEDLREIFCNQAGLGGDDADLAIDALKKYRSDADLPPAIQRIEFALKRKDVSRVTRILAMAYMIAGQAYKTQIERDYNWDFIPDELAAECIRAGKQNVNIELYSKKQG